MEAGAVFKNAIGQVLQPEILSPQGHTDLLNKFSFNKNLLTRIEWTILLANPLFFQGPMILLMSLMSSVLFPVAQLCTVLVLCHRLNRRLLKAQKGLAYCKVGGTVWTYKLK